VFETLSRRVDAQEERSVKIEAMMSTILASQQRIESSQQEIINLLRANNKNNNPHQQLLQFLKQCSSCSISSSVGAADGAMHILFCLLFLNFFGRDTSHNNLFFRPSSFSSSGIECQ
jgi:predicted PurR-regulated permease PerM